MRAALVAGGLLVAGCGSPPAEEQPLNDVSPVAALTRELRRELDGREPPQACGAPRSFTSARPILLLTARDCLSCRSVGYLLRQLGRRDAFDVLTPEADAGAVCEFLAQERSSAAVFGHRGRRVRDRLGDRFLLFRRDERGGISDAYLDADVGRLLARWDSHAVAFPKAP